jgi:hypothetical protein
MVYATGTYSKKKNTLKPARLTNTNSPNPLSLIWAMVVADREVVKPIDVAESGALFETRSARSLQC